MRDQPWPVWKGKEEEEEKMYLKKKITHSGEIYGPEKHSTHFFWCPSLFLFFYLYLFTFLPSSSCVVTLPCWCHVTNGLSWRKVKHEDKRRRRRLFLQPAQSFARTCTSRLLTLSPSVRSKSSNKKKKKTPKSAQPWFFWFAAAAAAAVRWPGVKNGLLSCVHRY